MKVDGRILTEAFGELHIQNDVIALGEQIKNAIDAEATKIIFDFTKVNTEKVITIHENGNGMDEEEFIDEWNSLGYSSKKQNNELLGGKGIGRFALFRLSKDICIYSKKKGKTAIYQQMLYDDIDSYDDISKLEFYPTKIEDSKWNDLCKFSHGTYIKMNNINKINLALIQRELENFNQPFHEKRILIECKYPADFTKRNFLKVSEAIKYAPFNLEAVFDNGVFTSCKCIVRDYQGGVRKTENISLESLNAYIEENLIDYERDFNVDKECLASIGKISVYIDSFFLDPKYMKKVEITPKIIKDSFLYSYQGINIYRNGVKLFGFGINDFLKMAEERLKRSGDNIDNKQTFGYVILSNQTKDKLIEQTNREGFVSNDYYKLLILILEKLVSQMGVFRKANKELILNDELYPKFSPKEKFLNVSESFKLSIKNRNKSCVEQEIMRLIKKSLNTNIPPEELNIKIDMDNYQETFLNKQLINVEISYEKEKCSRFSTVEVGFYNVANKKERALLWVDDDIKERISNKKIVILLNELTSLNIYKYPNGCAFLLRALIEISFNLFIKKYQSIYSLKVHYDDDKEEIVVNKTKNIAKTKDRINAVIDIIREQNVGVYTDGKAEKIIDNINKINFTIHKNNNFNVPENLQAFYNDIEQILLHVLKEISN